MRQRHGTFTMNIAGRQTKADLPDEQAQFGLVFARIIDSFPECLSSLVVVVMSVFDDQQDTETDEKNRNRESDSVGRAPPRGADRTSPNRPAQAVFVASGHRWMPTRLSSLDHHVAGYTELADALDSKSMPMLGSTSAIAV